MRARKSALVDWVVASTSTFRSRAAAPRFDLHTQVAWAFFGTAAAVAAISALLVATLPLGLPDDRRGWVTAAFADLDISIQELRAGCAEGEAYLILACAATADQTEALRNRLAAIAFARNVEITAATADPVGEGR
jgi:hypothetical protein